MTLKLPYQRKDSGLEDHKEEEGRGRGGGGEGREMGGNVPS